MIIHSHPHPQPSLLLRPNPNPLPHPQPSLLLLHNASRMIIQIMLLHPQPLLSLVEDAHPQDEAVKSLISASKICFYAISYEALLNVCL